MKNPTCFIKEIKTKYHFSLTKLKTLNWLVKSTVSWLFSGGSWVIFSKI